MPVVPSSFPFVSGRPCVQLRVAGHSAVEETLTLLVDTWPPNLHTLVLFPWVTRRVQMNYHALPARLTFHNRFRQPLGAGILRVTHCSWWPLVGAVRAAILFPPIGGSRRTNGDHALEGVIDGYAGFHLFPRRSMTIDFDKALTTVS